MPGRPRTTLKRIDELAWRAHAYGNDLYALMPKQYEKRPNPSDPICAAWREAISAAGENYRLLYELRTLLAEKVAKAEAAAASRNGAAVISGL